MKTRRKFLKVPAHCRPATPCRPVDPGTPRAIRWRSRPMPGSALGEEVTKPAIDANQRRGQRKAS